VMVGRRVARRRDEVAPGEGENRSGRTFKRVGIGSCDTSLKDKSRKTGKRGGIRIRGPGRNARVTSITHQERISTERFASKGGKEVEITKNRRRFKELYWAKYSKEKPGERDKVTRETSNGAQSRGDQDREAITTKKTTRPPKKQQKLEKPHKPVFHAAGTPEKEGV